MSMGNNEMNYGMMEMNAGTQMMNNSMGYGYDPMFNNRWGGYNNF